MWNRSTAPILPYERHPHYNRDGLNVEELKKSRARNIRKSRRAQHVLGQALSLALFRVTEQRKETEAERDELTIPFPGIDIRATEKTALVVVEVDLSFLTA